MANCINCGKKIGIMFSPQSWTLNNSIGLCPSCDEKALKIFGEQEHSVKYMDSKISEFIDAGFTEQGLAYLKEHCELKEKNFSKSEEGKKLLEKKQQAQEYAANQLLKLQASGHQYYCEYKVLTLTDNEWNGHVDAENMTEKLNNLGREGWELKASYCNELGKNAISALGLGTNSTVDEHILIFERKIKL